MQDDIQRVVMCNDVVEAVIPYGTSEDAAQDILVNLKMADKSHYMELQGLTRSEDAGRQYDDTRYWRVISVPIVSNSKHKKLAQIVIQFPVSVEVSREWEKEFFKLVDEIADHHNRVHPAQVMWLFGVGDVPSSMLIAASMRGQSLPESDGTLHLEYHSRERYAITGAPTLESLKLKAKVLAGQLVPSPLTDDNGGFKLDVAQKKWDLEDALFEIMYESFAVGRVDGRGEEVAKALSRAIMRETSATMHPGSLPIGIHLAMAMMLEHLPDKQMIITHEQMEATMDRVVKVVARHDRDAHHTIIKLEEAPNADDETCISEDDASTSTSTRVPPTMHDEE